MSVITEIYRALQERDVESLQLLLHPDFEGHIAAGMPYGLGGAHHGPRAMLTDVWGVIARWYDTAPYPERVIDAGDGLTIVTGRYRGRARSTGQAYEAEFAHIWRVGSEQARSFHQYTDTAQWIRATDAGGPPSGEVKGEQ